MELYRIQNWNLLYINRIYRKIQKAHTGNVWISLLHIYSWTLGHMNSKLNLQ